MTAPGAAAPCQGLCAPSPVTPCRGAALTVSRLWSRATSSNLFPVADSEADAVKACGQPGVEDQLVLRHPQPGEAPLNGVDTAGHCAQMNPGTGCAALRIVEVGVECLTEGAPSPFRVHGREDGGMGHPA